MAYLWNHFPSPMMTQSGEIAEGALAKFFYAGTSTPLTSYSDSGLTTPNSFPVAASISGVFAPIYLDYIDYRVRVTDANGGLIFDADHISNPAPSTGGGGGGGGGGIVTSTAQIFQTGDPIWRLRYGTIDGFVRMNAKTIGSPISGATERANSDTQALFYYLWNNLADSVAPVSSGRGSSAAADWSANKTITIPTMQGILAVGVDDLGGTPAGNIQAITTASVTNASVTATVSSAANMAIGMYVIIDGNAAGTIVNIVGTTITLSTPYLGLTNAGATFRASFFTDAQLVGSVGGIQVVTATANEMPSHTHTLTDPGHHHTYTIPTATVAGAGVAPVSQVGSATNTSNATTGITIASTGNGLPMNNIQPSRAGTFYMKL